MILPTQALFFLMYLAVGDCKQASNIPADLLGPIAASTAALLPACGGDQDIASFSLVLLKTIASGSAEGASVVKGLSELPKALKAMKTEFFVHQDEVISAANQLAVLVK